MRIHDDLAAKESAEEVGARAYTSGSHIVIGNGGSDRHTLAHELTHVIQQRQGPVTGTDNGAGMRISDPSDRFEREAEANAKRALSSPAGERSAQTAPPAERMEFGAEVSIQRFANVGSVIGSHPNQVYFVPETREIMLERARATATGPDPQAKQVQLATGPKWQYKCQFCANEYGPEHSWQFDINIDLDHIMPWSELMRNRGAYPGFPTLQGVPDWDNANDVQRMYNDLDNLRLSCPGHNRTRGSNMYFDIRNAMNLNRILS
ncbi:eCIS core domain-containing protein [Streptomyces buecherae]|uniref:eCIS core domain-containing protein n=1 Tax=Streptomyces buecherae TaxID=2763006 RepID=UPI0035567A02